MLGYFSAEIETDPLALKALFQHTSASYPKKGASKSFEEDESIILQDYTMRKQHPRLLDLANLNFD